MQTAKCIVSHGPMSWYADCEILDRRPLVIGSRFKEYLCRYKDYYDDIQERWFHEMHVEIPRYVGAM